ncbi:hypothetical protein BJ741DRAFT_612807 [Chytriomyces cf. hyalinus JEL632]|nr:hypothetical protein BJ741DRAFT_612807 [Chytriomyces cf. hyalinus JEL632]
MQTRRVIPQQDQRVRQTRVLAKPYSLKGDAEIPADEELLLLEIEARRKVRADRERLQPLHTRYVAEMREQLEKERLMRVFGATDIGMLGASGSSEQVVQNQAALLDLCLHEAVAIDILGPIWIPELWNWPMDLTSSATDLHTFLQAESQQDSDCGSNMAHSISNSGSMSISVTSEIDLVSFTNFEELFDAFPLPALP